MDSLTTQPPLSSGHPAPVESQVKPVAAPPRPLVGDTLRHPSWLWLTHVLPVTLLLWSGRYTYSLVSGNLSADERWICLAEALGLGAVIGISTVMALRGQRRARLISNAQCGVLLGLGLIVISIGIGFTNFTLPWSLPEWIVGRDELLYRFMCLGMPGAFYPLLLLASYPTRVHAGFELAKAFGIVVLGLSVVSGMAYAWGDFMVRSMPAWLGITIWIGISLCAGLVLSGGMIRATLVAYTSVRRMRPAWQRTFMFVIAVIGPIAGLELNRTLPFPTDFQAPLIYAFSLVNGGLLMLPVVRSVFWHRLIWLAQCVMFPFSAYFFLVFLPWLPASPFAIIILGAGFLMLVPLVLGLVHGYRIADGYNEEIRDGKWWKPALAGTLAVLVLPCSMMWSFWQDRQSLDQALDYIYAPDYRKDITYHGDLGRLQSSLQHLRDMKHGIFLPFISPAYDSVVFHGLVLPDAKIDNLERSFFGDKARTETNRMMRSLSDNNWSDWNGPVTPPPHNVALNDVQVTSKADGPVTTTRLTLSLKSGSDWQSEYIGAIHLPEGVYVSDFGLYIDNDLVPARIVEKKTAMWVYEQISRTEHRDPGLLIYKSRTELELRVFPFAAGETRRVELELVHPNAAPIAVTIGDRTLELNPGATSPKTAITSCTTTLGSMAVAEGTDLAGYALHRKPYLDVLIDCSQGTNYSAQTLAESLRQAKAAFPDAEFARVSALNYEARDLVTDLVPIDQLDAATIQKNLLPERGGFLEDRFLKRGLLQAYDLMQTGAAHALLRPQFVIISSQSQAALREGNIETFLRLAPDARIVYSQSPGEAAEQRDMADNHLFGNSNADAVVLWQWADRYAVTPAGTRAVATFPGNTALSGQPLLYQASSGQFTPAGTVSVVPPSSSFGDGVRTWAAEDEASLNPSILENGAAALIGLSKHTRILIPDSSYIAVENAAQWRAMEEKEKLKLKNKQVFEFEETTSLAPEPATWILMAVGLAVLWVKRRAKSRFAREIEKPRNE